MARLPAIRPAAAALVVVATLAACGSVGARPAPAQSPTAPPTLTEASAGSTYSMRVGETVTVSLAQVAGWQPWSVPVSSDETIVKPAALAAPPSGTPFAGFRAIAPGRTTIHAEAGRLCSPGNACAAIARSWRVTIEVS